MLFEIPRCFDSHLHFLATGEMDSVLSLSGLNHPSELQQLAINQKYYRGDWLIGFGWDHHAFPNQQIPSRHDLDKVFPNIPVAFSRCDGHALWVNTAALKKVGVLDKFPNGLLQETDKFVFEANIPRASLSQQLDFITVAQNKMNRQGFTHIREMTGNKSYWSLLKQLDEKKSLTVYVEMNFSFDDELGFEKSLQDAIDCRADKIQHVKVAGVKFFLDGSLGSETALLSQNYQGKSHRGQQLWNAEQIKNILIKSWQANMAVAVHCIGDQAVDLLMDCVLEVQRKGIHGELNIEHGEVIRKSTIEKMKDVNVRVHMQPCHWLSDHKWLSDKLGTLAESAFPWAQLQKQNIPISWGSDAPIEPPSVLNNLKALKESAQQGISAFQGNQLSSHSHPDANWGGGCRTTFESEDKISVFFDNQLLVL